MERAKMTRAFCTLFDKNYLYQGLALYQSLLKHSEEFILYVLCIDEISYSLIKKINKENLVPIVLADIENDEILEVKSRTTHGQYCWVCQPLVCLYILSRFKIDSVTYLEADSIFFHSPSVLFSELESYSVSLVPHRYSPQFDQTTVSGKYCVQFNFFRNNQEAHEVLLYWKSCCFKYSKDKPFLFPGQKSLDDWTQKFHGVKEIEHLGAGVAPWNVQQYIIAKSKAGIALNYNIPIVFYHFHQYARYDDGRYELGSYPLAKSVVQNIYIPYIQMLREVESFVRSIDPSFNYRRELTPPPSLKTLIKSYMSQNIPYYIRSIKRRIKGTYNIYTDDELEKI
jgi:hypothetical protein